MNKLILAQSNDLTMSTREIATLLDKTHSNIKISAERLKAVGTIALQGSNYEHNGNFYIEYLLNKRDSMILVAQNSPQFTAAIIDRWQELEQSQPAQLPSSYLEALEHLVSKEKLLLEQAPKVAFVDKYVAAEGNKGFREVAKLLQVNERQFREFLSESKIMYKLAGGWVPYSNHISAGRFYVTTGIANDHVFNESKFTPKGVAWIDGLLIDLAEDK